MQYWNCCQYCGSVELFLFLVLVAAHLLQMPSVVSLCHALVQSSATPAGALLLPAAVGPSVPPALSVWQSLARLVPQVRGHSQSSKPSLVRPTPTRLRPDAAQTLSPAPRPEDTSSGSGLLQEDAMDVDEAASLRHHQEVKPQSQSSARREPSRCSLAATSSTSTSSSNTSSSGHVILDIAACDGPVFFERIINKAYGSQASSQDDSEDDGDINVEDLDSGDEGVSGNALVGGPHDEDTVKSSLCNSSSGRTYHCVYCNHTFKSHYCYQKHKRRHINPITIELNKLRGTTAPQNSSRPVTTVVNITPPVRTTPPPPPLPPAPSISSALGSTPSSSSSSSNNEGGGVLDAGGSSLTSNTSLRLSPTFSGKASLASSSPLSHSSSGEGEVKVLDLNVQYFPCKTCGSKFPSYYFVHKHRRLCHADEENQSKGATTSGGIGGGTLSGPSQKPKDNSADRPKPGNVPSLHAQTSTSTSAPASPKVAPPPPPPPPPLPPQPRPTMQPQQEQEDQQEQQQMPQIPPSAEPR
ncbi:uncharacterized protein LOC143020916 isoform X2 [Oratosquilla oratoria]|uniref:uncharacterized protein LOC143020916 isoform X2 n=1 Tax=Oratosquilla oratoria TaxID=337810 RepID=UPI003F75A715